MFHSVQSHCHMITALGRFIQADSIVPAPGNPQSLNRYAYVYNNPLRYTDPTGFEPTRPGASAIMLGGLEDLGGLYESQGRFRDGRTSNLCGSANVAMAVNLVSWIEKRQVRVTLAEAQGAVPWHAQAGVGGIAGATMPRGVRGAFNSLSMERDLGWTATVQSHGTLEDIVACLMNDEPMTALLVFNSGSAHYVTIVGYDPETDRIYYLDPMPSLQDTAATERVQWEPWSDFNRNWSRRVIWNLTTPNTLIVYTRSEPMPVSASPRNSTTRTSAPPHFIR